MNPTLLLIKATVVLGSALVVARALGHANPRWRLLVCETAALGVVLLPLLSLAPLRLSLPASGPAGQRANPAGSGGAMPFPSRTPNPGATTDAGQLRTTGSPNDLAEGPDPAQGAIPVPFTITTVGPKRNAVRSYLTAIYFTILALLLGRCLRAAARLRRVIASLQAPDQRVLSLLTRLAGELGMNSVPRLLIAEARMAPLACGLRRGTIVVPAALTDPNQERTLELALRHELHHLANRDLYRALGLEVLATVLWFHPLAWLLRRSHSLAIEELSDRVASERAGTARYTATLASLALALRSDRDLSRVAMGWFQTPQIVSRLRRLKRAVPHGPLSIRSRCLAVLALAGPLLLVVSSLGFAHPTNRDEDRAASRLSAITLNLPEETIARAGTMAERALNYLLKLQRADGSFSSRLEGDPVQQTGTTALAGMAFFAHGGDHPASRWHEAMNRSLDYVLGAQGDDGLFSGGADRAGASFYHHTIATWFLASVKDRAGAERRARIEAALPPAVKVILDAQKVTKAEGAQGGWRYTLQSKDSDLSCSAWALRALLVAKEVGQAVPAEAIESALSYVLPLQNRKDGGFSYTGGGTESNLPRTGMGLYLLQKTGRGSSPGAGEAARYLDQNGPGRVAQAGPYEFYGMYWCSSAMSLRGGEDARRHAERMIATCFARQEADGSLRDGLGPVLATICVANALAPSH